MAGPSDPLKAWAGTRIAVLSPTPSHPQDFGNRKRIYRICSRFAEEGARITFIHYPAEHEWRGQTPFAAQRAMDAAWAHHYTIPTTRISHKNPAGQHHSIDEWWDRAIEDFLVWLFAQESFDVFIVNYSWLSKALEFAPAATFKILDTHDKFSGRKEMLQSLKLDPEFFYTTEAQEKIALGRADLVWAIKQEEAAQLQALSERPVLALPHLDPFGALARPAPDAEGYLRVGVIGARNNVNRMNITEFLREAEPVFREAFAAVKIVIAGSVCDLLEEAKGPFVELLGSVAAIEDFYRAVDCVAVPMQRSTGLKIKTGEALSFGLPVISLAHAFEGYEPAHKLHTLADFREMAQTIVELSFAPRAQLETLAAASGLAHKKTAATITKAFRRSDTLAWKTRRLIVVAVDSQALVQGSVHNLVLQSMLEFLRPEAIVAVLVARGRASDVTGNFVVVERLRRVVVAADLADAEEHRSALERRGVDVFDVGQYLAAARPQLLIADVLHPALATAKLPETAVVLRAEMIALSDPDAKIADAAGRFGHKFLTSPAQSAELARTAEEIGAKFIPSTVVWRRSAFYYQRAEDVSGHMTVAILGRAEAPCVALAAGMAHAWGMAPIIVSPRPCGRGSEPPAQCLAASKFIAAIVAGELPPPDFAVDLSADEPGIPFAVELLRRLHTPVASTSPVGIHGSMPIEDRPLHAATQSELWAVLRSMAVDPPQDHIAGLKHTWQELEHDKGWLELWRRCASFAKAEEVEFA